MSVVGADSADTCCGLTHMIGQTISHYRVTARLGAGGMGEVYQATDTKLGRQVALKFLPREFSTDPERRRRLELEATSASSLDHPNILTIYEINEYEGQPFIAMAYVDGDTLKARLSRGQLPLDAAVRYGVHLASALGAAHARDIVHRDVKPDNVLIGSDDRARLTDFGLAKLKESSGITNRGATVGTVGYMSPEQAQGLTVDARSDVFSLGVMLYEMLTGRLPFAAEHAAAALYSIVHENPPPIRDIAPRVPEEIARIVDRALAKKPEDRYPDGAAVEQDLRAAARSLEIARVSSGQIPVYRSQRRQRALWAITGSVAIIAGLILAVIPRMSRSPGHEAKADENTLAVLYFENLSDPGDTARVGDIITELLTTDLSGSEYLKVVSSQRLYDLLKQEKLDPSRRIGRGIAIEIARKAGAARMLSGALSKLGGRTIITAQLVDVASGSVLGSERVDGSDLYAMVDDLSLRIKRRLGLSESQVLAGDVRIADVTTANPEAYREYLVGMDFYHALDWKNAHVHFDRALALDSTFALAYLHKGVAYISDGQREKGLAMLAAAGRHMDHATGCDRLLLQVFALDLGRRWDVDDAIRDLKRATVECPTHKEPFFWVANLALGFRQYDTTILYSRRALELDPDYPFALLSLAEALTARREFAAGRPIIERYMTLRPKDVVPYVLLADVFRAQHQFDSAIVVLRGALQIAPSNRIGYASLSNVFMLQGQPDSALAWSERMASADDNPYTRISSLREVARIRSAQGRFDEAVRLLNRADQKAKEARLLDQQAEIENTVGNLYLATERYADAIAHFHASGQIDTLNAPGLINEATTRALTGDASGASAVFAECNRRWTGRIDSTLLQSFGEAVAAFSAMSAGQYQSAIEHFTAGRRLSNDSTEWRQPLGESYLRVQKYDLAIRELGELRRESEIEYPSYDYIRGLYFLAEAYAQSGRPAEAREPLARFLVFWGNADWDVPLARKARELYARLSAQ